MSRSFKTILIIVFFLMPLTSFAQNYWLNHSNAGDKDLRCMYFLDSLRGWVGGDSAGIYYTSNGGSNWTRQDANNRDYDIIDIFFLDQNRGWALTWEILGDDPDADFGTDILSTTNGGLNWVVNRYPGPDNFMNTIYFRDSLNGYLGGHPDNLRYTTDGGVSWLTPNVQIDTTQISSGALIHDIKFFNKDFGLASGGYIDILGAIFRTTNSGVNWVPYTVGPEPVQAIHFIDSSKIIAVGGDFEYGSGIVRTTNGGLNWAYRSLEVFGIANSLGFRTVSEGWAPLGFAQVFIYTLDTGVTWTNVYTPDSIAVNDIQFTDKRNGFAVGQFGRVLKYNTAMISVQNESSPVPDYSLFQNYPNPFNPSTFIKYKMAKAGYVQLKVFDIRGREVAVLKEGFSQAGEHTFTFEGTGLSSGVYISKLEVFERGSSLPGFTQSKKMILVK